MEGILPLWKEKGMTSHDCVFRLRKLLHMKKIGHAGTLDPEVDGVLLICLGRATKATEYLMAAGKAYEGTISLGYSTTTEDATGELVAEKKLLEPVSCQAIDQAMAELTGEITQVPPMYSAVKVNGRKLYEYARAGETVERPRRKAIIKEFYRLEQPIWNEPAGTQEWRFHVVCSKGTYIRTLAVDTGQRLGFPAHMASLTRIESAGFTQASCLTLRQVEEKMAAGTLTNFLQPIERAVAAFPRIDLSPELAERVKHGAVLPKKLLGAEAELAKLPVALFYQDQVLSLYDDYPTRSGWLKPIRVFRNE